MHQARARLQRREETHAVPGGVRQEQRDRRSRPVPGRDKTRRQMVHQIGQLAKTDLPVAILDRRPVAPLCGRTVQQIGQRARRRRLAPAHMRRIHHLPRMAGGVVLCRIECRRPVMVHLSPPCRRAKARARSCRAVFCGTFPAGRLGYLPLTSNHLAARTRQRYDASDHAPGSPPMRTTMDEFLDTPAWSAFTDMREVRQTYRAVPRPYGRERSILA